MQILFFYKQVEIHCCIHLMLTHLLGNKTKISFVGENKSTIQIILMDHNMRKIKIVYIHMLKQNLQRTIL
jgi:hypothetical protein